MTNHISALAAAIVEHNEVAAKLVASCADPLQNMIDCCVDCVRRDGKLLFFGNGGSASEAQHLAAELMVRYRNDRPPIAAISLVADISVITACSNDLSFDEVFSRQIEGVGNRGDVAIAISTSGKSRNVIRGLECAKQKGLVTAGLTGEGGGAMNDLVDHLVKVPSKSTTRIQEAHILLGHVLCESIENELSYK